MNFLGLILYDGQIISSWPAFNKVQTLLVQTLSDARSFALKRDRKPGLGGMENPCPFL